MRKLLVGLAFALVAASPAFAQSSNVDPGMARGVRPFVAPPGLYRPGLFGQASPEATVSREEAIMECDRLARGLPQLTWGVQQIDVYRSCMARKGHME